MRAKVLFFGVLREIVGFSSDDADLAGGTTVAGVLDSYAARFPQLSQLSSSIVAAKNQEFAAFSTRVEDGDEVAFLPPVSGGCASNPFEVREAGNYFALTRQPIDPRSLTRVLLNGSEGAVVTFEGVARNNTGGRPTRFLEYESYEPMAFKLIAEIGRELAARPEIGRIAIVHRLGRILIGETSLAVCVTAPHRRAAFETALEAVDRIKKRVPIWKKEHFEDGAVWAEGAWGQDVPVAR